MQIVLLVTFFLVYHVNALDLNYYNLTTLTGSGGTTYKILAMHRFCDNPDQEYDYGTIYSNDVDDTEPFSLVQSCADLCDADSSCVAFAHREGNIDGHWSPSKTDSAGNDYTTGTVFPMCQLMYASNTCDLFGGTPDTDGGNGEDSSNPTGVDVTELARTSVISNSGQHNVNWRWYGDASTSEVPSDYDSLTANLVKLKVGRCRTGSFPGSTPSVQAIGDGLYRANTLEDCARHCNALKTSGCQYFSFSGDVLVRESCRIYDENCHPFKTWYNGPYNNAELGISKSYGLWDDPSYQSAAAFGDIWIVDNFIPVPEHLRPEELDSWENTNVVYLNSTEYTSSEICPAGQFYTGDITSASGRMNTVTCPGSAVLGTESFNKASNTIDICAQKCYENNLVSGGTLGGVCKTFNYRTDRSSGVF